MDTKVISYRDTYVPVPGITRRNWKGKLFKLTLVILVFTIMIYSLKLVTTTTNVTRALTPDRVSHFNPCQHITPEPEVILQEKFDSRDYFFPYSYKERKCAPPIRLRGKENPELFQTCFGDEYHCVTRYQTLPVMRIPYPGNTTYAHWKVETVHIAVACECSVIQYV